MGKDEHIDEDSVPPHARGPKGRDYGRGPGNKHPA